MKEKNFEQRLKSRIGTDAGFRLPEGSLEELYVHVLEVLPEHKSAPAVRFTFWQRVKPYVYLAAMFAGIWCTMKVFHLMSSPEISLDSPPAMVAEAAASLPSYDYDWESGYDDFDLEEEVSGSYSSIEEFEKDFDYELKPEYASMQTAGVSGIR